MARYTMHVQNPGYIEFTLTMTMRLGDWHTLRKQIDTLPYHHGVVALRAAIGDMVQQIETTYEYRPDDDTAETPSVAP